MDDAGGAGAAPRSLDENMADVQEQREGVRNKLSQIRLLREEAESVGGTEAQEESQRQWIERALNGMRPHLSLTARTRLLNLGRDLTVDDVVDKLESVEALLSAEVGRLSAEKDKRAAEEGKRAADVHVVGLELTAILDSFSSFNSHASVPDASAFLAEPQPRRSVRFPVDLGESATAANLTKGAGTQVDLNAILAKAEVPRLESNVGVATRALRIIAADISVSSLFHLSAFGSAAHECLFQAWFNDLTVNRLPARRVCHMYSRRPPDANARTSREMPVAGMGSRRRVDSALHGAYEDAPLCYAAEVLCWIPIEVRPLFRKNQNVSSVEMEARRQAMSFSGMALKVAALNFGAQHVWATSMAVNVLGVELQLLEVQRDSSGMAAELRTYVGERQPLLPAGVALDVWSIRPHAEADNRHIEYIQRRLEAAWDAEQTAMCDEHRAQAAHAPPANGLEAAAVITRSQASVTAHRCERCQVAPPPGLELLLRLLCAPPECKIVAPFWDGIQAPAPLGRFLGAGASAAVFAHADGVIKVFFDIPEARSRAEKETMDMLNDRIPADGRPDCRIARLVRAEEVLVGSKKRFALVMKPRGEPLTRVLRTLGTEHDRTRLAQIVEEDVANTLRVVHEEANLAHLDIRPENIVLVAEDDGEEHAYLVDWGLSLGIGKTTSFRGCEPYASQAMMGSLMRGTTVSVERDMDADSLALTVRSIKEGGLRPRGQSE